MRCLFGTPVAFLFSGLVLHAQRKLFYQKIHTGWFSVQPIDAFIVMIGKEGYCDRA